MKIKGQKLDTIKTAFTLVFNHVGKEKVRECHQLASPKRIAWGIWHRASDNMRYDDNHPNFHQGNQVRIVPYNPEFNVYDDDTNDNHIQTVILKILKDLLK